MSLKSGAWPNGTRSRVRRRGAVPASALAAGALVVASAMPASAATTTIGSDPFTQATCKVASATNHRTQVEPDSFAYGSTIVAVVQTGRAYDGGACAIGFSTSTDNGATWTSGLIPGITKWAGGGAYDRVSDPAVAYDAKHNVWLVSSLALREGFGGAVSGAAIVTSRSTDGGFTWSSPVTTATGTDLDKNWIVCDNTATSTYYGNCYTQWDDHAAGNRLGMSTSSDGGLTWGATTTNNSGVIGGQPVVRPDGTVIVPTANANETAIGAFNSTDGGTTWSPLTTIATVKHHTVAGALREGPLPSAEVDGAGTVYVAWADCRFRRACRSNDIVISKSTNATGTKWTKVARVPIDDTKSGVDHFIPGLAVNRSTSGTTAQLGLTYYFYPSGSTQLSVGFTSSGNAGSTWSTPTTIASGMPTTWIANTSQGRMVGDYISTSYGSDNLAHGVFTIASAPTAGTECTLDNCNQSMATFSAGLAAGALSSVGDPVLYGGGGAAGSGLWNVVDNNGVRHR